MAFEFHCIGKRGDLHPPRRQAYISLSQKFECLLVTRENVYSCYPFLNMSLILQVYWLSVDYLVAARAAQVSVITLSLCCLFPLSFADLYYSSLDVQLPSIENMFSYSLWFEPMSGYGKKCMAGVIGSMCCFVWVLE